MKLYFLFIICPAILRFYAIEFRVYIFYVIILKIFYLSEETFNLVHRWGHICFRNLYFILSPINMKCIYFYIDAWVCFPKTNNVDVHVSTESSSFLSNNKSQCFCFYIKSSWTALFLNSFNRIHTLKIQFKIILIFYIKWHIL